MGCAGHFRHLTARWESREGALITRPVSKMLSGQPRDRDAQQGSHAAGSVRLSSRRTWSPGVMATSDQTSNNK